MKKIYSKITKMAKVHFATESKIQAFCLIFFLVTIGVSLSAQSISWTGSTDTDWDTATNWSTSSVPTASSDVIISSSSNPPVLSSNAFARSFVINDGGELTIDVGAVLTIEVTTSPFFTFYNRGICTNNGILNIGVSSNAGQYYALWNGRGGATQSQTVTPTFTNSATGVINIDNGGSSSWGVTNAYGAIFNNYGQIHIEQVVQIGLGNTGANSIFTNYQSGEIHISQCQTGLTNYSAAPTFVNEGLIDIGEPGSNLFSGITIEGEFDNTSTGIINIDYCSTQGIRLSTGGGYLDNDGIINIGQEANVGTNGILSYLPFTNNGTLNVDRFTNNGIYQITGGPFQNNGLANIGSVGTPFTLISGNANQFSNNTNGEIQGSGSIAGGHTINNGGTLSPGNSPGIFAYTSSQDFENSIINIEINGTGTAGTDYDQITVSAAATLTANTVLNVTTGYTPSAGDEVVILDAASLSGTFSTSSNLDGWDIAYDTPNAGDVTLKQAPLIAPAITCPDNITVNNEAGECAAAVSFAATETIAEPASTITYSHDSGTDFPVGATTVTATATNAVGSDNCSFTVTVSDNEVPEISCPADIQIDCPAPVSYADATATDNCSTAGVDAGNQSFSYTGAVQQFVVPAGVTSLTINATGAGGGDGGHPVNGQSAGKGGLATGTLAVSPGETLNIYVGGQGVAGNGSTGAGGIGGFNGGGTGGTASWQPGAAGGGGGASDIRQGGTDLTNRVIVAGGGGGAVDRGNGGHADQAGTDWIGNAPGESSGPVDIHGGAGTQSAGGVAGIGHPSGNGTAGILGTGGSGPNASRPGGGGGGGYYGGGGGGARSAGNIVTGGGGGGSSYIDGVTGGSTSSSSNVGNGTIAISWDAAPTTLTVSQISGLSSGANFPTGVNTIGWQATDAAGNSSTCSFNVTVSDTEVPTIVCAGDITQDAEANCDAVVTWSAPAVTENCTGETVTSTHDSGDTFPMGTTEVGYTVTDAAGNVGTCTFNVIIEDNTAPTIDCPAAQALTADSNCDGIMIDLVAMATATDNCAGTLTVSQDIAVGASFTAGTVTLTATDAASNSAICTVEVTLEDTTAPNLACPANIEVTADAGACAQLGYFLIPKPTDNCDADVDLTVVSTTATLFSFSNFHVAVFNVGIHEVTYTAEDDAGNEAECTLIVTVNDVVAPTIVGCPTAPITADSPDDECGTNVQFGLIYPNDDCTNSTLTSTHISGDYFDVGSTEVVFTATDESNNEGICAFNIIVSDVTAPVVACQDAAVMLDANGAATTTVAELVTSVTDNCAISLANVALDVSSFDCSQVGTPVTVTATATDGGGNTATCTSIITVTDEIAPTAACQDLTLSLDAAGAASVTAADIDNGSDDNCPNFTLAITDGAAAYTCADAGMSHTLTLTITDASSQTATCTSMVSVIDDTNPTITCPSDIAANTDLDVCTVAVTYAVTGDDNCAYTITQGEGMASGADFPLGATDNAYTITDASGNTATCTFSVTISDAQAPNAICQDVTVELDAAGNAAITESDVDNGSNDNCSATVTLSIDDNAFDCADVTTGATVTLTVTDEAGNSSTCTSSITVEDKMVPVFDTCPSDITQGNDVGSCEAAATWTPPTVSDNCATSMGSSHNPGDVFPVGSTEVTYTVTDAAGNLATCAFNVIIEDTETPVIACPSDIAQNNTQGECGAAVTWADIVSSDNCPDSAVTSTHASGDVFPVGTTEVGYTITDAAGNVATCAFNVVISDTELPVIAGCPANIAQDNDLDACDAAVMWTAPTATDNCTQTLTSTHNSGDTFAVGTTTVTYTSTDVTGNMATCAFDITVSDAQPPTITCIADIVQNTDSGSCDAVVTYDEPVGTDNCPNPVTELVVGLASGETFPIGSTDVTYSVTDAAGNVVSCTFNVTIEDNEAPVFAGCPSDITQVNTVGVCEAAVTWTAPSATDNCSVTMTNSHDSGDIFAVGTTTVTYTAVDAAGNSSECAFDVTVEDTELPVIACPSDIVQNNDAGLCGAAVTWADIVSSDNCPESVVTSTHASGDVFPVGTTEVGYTITDAAGNVATCAFNVVISDTELPVIANCPANIAQDNDADVCGAVVNWTAPTATDNCGQTFTSTHDSGETFAIGTTTVTYSSMDVAGNSAACSFDVTVSDVQAPVIACPADIVQDTDVGSCDAVVNYATPLGTDNCPNPVTELVDGLASGSTFPIGSTDVTYSVTDASGNAVSCTFNVTIEDNEAPVFDACPSDINAVALSTGCSGSATWTIPTATDNCSVNTVADSEGVSIIIVEPTAFGTFPGGTTAITYTATDDSGNETICTFNVIVEDSIVPTLSACPTDMVLNTDANSCEAQAFWTVPTFSDNCPDTEIVASHTPGALFPTGTTAVGYTVTDAAGNVATCNFSITVSDSEKPQLDCPIVDVMATGDGNCAYTIPDLSAMITATDNCTSSPVITQSPNVGDVVTEETIITYIATDDAGNATSCKVDIIVPDAFAASISAVFASCPNSPDGEVSVTVTGGTEPYSYSWTGSSATTATITGVTAGTYTVDVTDANGCSITQMIDVTGTDTTNPIADCQNITVSLDENGSIIIDDADLDNSSSDDCGIATYTASQTTFDCGDLGVNAVTLTVVDGSGNQANCSATVTVENPLAGTPEFCGMTYTIPLTESGNAFFTSSIIGTVTDNCGDVLVFVNGEALDCSDIGNTTTSEVTYINGNGVGSCDVNISVVDILAPVVVCQDLTVSLDDDGNASITANDIGSGSTDNCSGLILSLSQTDFTCANTGIQTVILTATDGAGNSETCTSSVDVVDDSVPMQAYCGTTITLSLDETGTATLVAADFGALIDNCTDASVAFFGTTDYTCSQIGVTTTISTFAVDQNNNFSFCIVNVTVVDDTAPIAICQDFTLSLDDSGNGLLTPEDIGAGSGDNCTPLFSLDMSVFGCTDVGAHTVTLSVDDAAGNPTATCTSIVTVVDDSVPTPTFCGSTITLELDNTGNTVLDPANLAVTADNCQNMTAIALFGTTQFNCSHLSVTTNVTAFVVDPLQNYVSCIISVEVTDPLNVCAPDIIDDVVTESSKEEEAEMRDYQMEENNGVVDLFNVSAAPNPFAVQTKLSYQLSVPAYTKISVYDARGQLVEVLTEGVKSGHKHNIYWSPKGNVTQGLYFVTIETEDNSVQVVKVNYAP